MALGPLTGASKALGWHPKRLIPCSTMMVTHGGRHMQQLDEIKAEAEGGAASRAEA